jgi:polyisoprenoid-binding protein YceI
MHYVAGFSASAQFRRSAFGSTRSAPDVGDRIDVHIEAEGLRDNDAQEQASGHDKEP